MQPYRSDRVVRVLTAIVSVAYFVVWIGGIATLVAIPLAKALTSVQGRGAVGAERKWTFDVPVPAGLPDAEATVQTAWGPARLVNARGSLELPVEAIPWGGVASLWLVLAVGLGLMLLTLYHLRRIFQRVRDGAPFDAQNALRMRTVGLLLLAGVAYNGIMDLVASILMRRGLTGSEVTVRVGIDVDPMVVFIALVLVALAEIFRRGAELEDEQALVV